MVLRRGPADTHVHTCHSSYAEVLFLECPLMRALPFGVYEMAAVFWKLPNAW